MPELNGWEALKRIVALKPRLPVIIITAHSDQQSWVEPSGAWALLEKPLDIPLLLSTVRELTEQPLIEPPHTGTDRPLRFKHHLPKRDDFPDLMRRSGINE
jgi:DNA-binding NtrC family response regulator